MFDYVVNDTPQETAQNGDEFVIDREQVPQSKKFRFKAKVSKDHDQRTRSRSSYHSSSSHSGNRHHHRRKRRKVSPPPVDDPSAYDDSNHNLPPEAAFRESLFDALGDDEGAAFWEGVYGQPIHNYPNTSVNQETGELEQMTEEEYAQYVRRKMWEKSHEGIEVERENRRRKQREEEKKRTGGEGSRYEADFEKGRIFDFEVEESLRRGEQRRQRRHWKTLWEDYLQKWRDLQQLVASMSKNHAHTTKEAQLHNKIAWPVESGRLEDLARDQIENFFRNGTKNAGPERDRQIALLNALKVERVRWHPDKIQQRYGSLGLDEQTIKGVTAVFQVVDRMWNEWKEQRG